MSKEPNRNIYVGHRYVPKIMGEWDKTIKYEGLSIVLNEGHSYTSKGYVPVGIDIKNEEFWALTGNYNAQVENYRQDVARLSDDVDDLRIYVDGEIIDLKTFVNDNMTQFEQEMNVKHDTLTTNVNNNISDFKSEVNTNLSDLETDVNTNINGFKSEVNTNINGFKSDVNTNIDGFKSEVNDVNAEQTKNIRDISVTPLMFGAKGDGVSDDTQALQDTINYCIDEGLVLHSHPDKVYMTNGNIITGYINMSGVIKLTALTDNQEHVLRIESKINSDCELIINGDNKAKHGIIGTKFGRSKFYKTEVERCKVWGMIYLPSGNNNFVQHDYFRAYINGKREDYSMTKVSETDNVLSSVTGYGTYEISGNIDNIYKENNVTYFLNYNDQAYKIKSITNNIIEVYNLNAGNVGGQINVSIYSGGGLNIPKHGDNGVGTFGNADIFSNYGVGVNISSLYGHNFNHLVAQGNAIGLCSNDYTLGMTINSPYFELNRIDVVVWNYMTGVMTQGIFNTDKFQTLTGRVTGEFMGIRRLKVVSDDIGTLSSSTPPRHNSSVSLPVVPGFTNNYSLSSTSDFNLLLDNDEKYDGDKNFTAIANLSLPSITSGRNLNISLSNNNGDTIEGSAEYTHPHQITGNTTVIIFRTRNDWKVNVVSNNVFINVNYPPVYVGQIAVYNGKAYVSTGIESKEDWTPISIEQVEEPEV